MSTEKHYLKKALVRNGYPGQIFDKTIANFQNTRTEAKEVHIQEPWYCLIVLSEKIWRLGQQYHLRFDLDQRTLYVAT